MLIMFEMLWLGLFTTLPRKDTLLRKRHQVYTWSMIHLDKDLKRLLSFIFPVLFSIFRSHLLLGSPMQKVNIHH